MRPAFIAPIVVFLLLAGVFGIYLYQVGSGGKDISTVPSVLIDKPVPEFTLPPIEGRTDGFSSTDLKDQVALVNVFASWCQPCRAEHPILMGLAKDGVPIYGINYKDKPEDAKAFLAELGDAYRRIGADSKGRVSIEWGVYGYPETFVVDAMGHIRYRHVGPIMPRDLDEIIKPMLKRLKQ